MNPKYYEYFVTQITRESDTEAYATLTTPVHGESLDDALRQAKALWHQIMASVCANAKVEHALVFITDVYGGTVKLDTVIPDDAYDHGE